MGWLKHAFAVDSQDSSGPTAEQRAVVERVCHEIVRRRLTTPAIVFLEMSQPLNFLGAQALHFFAPFISVITDGQGHKNFAAFLEQRGSIDYISRRIEALDSEARQREQRD